VGEIRRFSAGQGQDVSRIGQAVSQMDLVPQQTAVLVG